MYWYLEKPKDRPIHQIRRLHKLRDQGYFDKELPKSDNSHVKIAKELRLWESALGRYFYTPNKKEREFFLSPKFCKSISGGNRSGKTATCAMDVVMQVEGWHPLQKENLIKLSKEAYEDWVREWCQKLLDEKKWLKDPPIAARCVAVDFANAVEKALGPEYVKWATKSELKKIEYENEKKRKITWKNKSYVEFMSHDQDLDTHGMVARDIVHFDEEAPYEYWIEGNMRVISTNGRLLYGATAVEGVSWSDEEIFKKGENGHKDFFFIEMSTYENPTITQAMINKIKGVCRTETDINIRIYGKRVRRGGSVYPMAKDEYPWIIPPFTLPKKEGILILAIDVHPKVEQACLWTWVDFTGKIEVEEGQTFDLIDGLPNFYECAELFVDCNMPELAHRIKEKEKEIGRKHDFCLLDPSAWVEDQTKVVSQSAADQLADNGIYAEKGSKDLMGGILKVKEVLSIEDFVNNVTLEHPRLMTFEHNKRTRWERLNYHYPKPAGKRAEDMPIKQKPVDRDDHMMEDERRTVVYVIEKGYDLIEAKDEHPAYAPDGTLIDVTFDDEEDYGIQDAILG